MFKNVNTKEKQVIKEIIDKQTYLIPKIIRSYNDLLKNLQRNQELFNSIKESKNIDLDELLV